MDGSSRHRGGTPGLRTDTHEQQRKRSNSPLSHQLLVSSSKQQRVCCLSNSWPRKRNLFLAQPRHMSFHGSTGAERNPQEREPRAAGQTPGNTLSWITADLGTRRGSGCALWNIFPGHWMSGVQVGGAVSSGINSCEASFK